MIKINPFTSIFTTNLECNYMFRYHQAKKLKLFKSKQKKIEKFDGNLPCSSDGTQSWTGGCCMQLKKA